MSAPQKPMPTGCVVCRNAKTEGGQIVCKHNLTMPCNSFKDARKPSSNPQPFTYYGSET